MRINKKFLQFIAALMILVFHLGIPLGKADAFIFKIGYIGVDIFFFLSAYSLADKQIDYAGLLKNRFLNIYLKFAAFVIIAAFYKSMTVLRTIKVLAFIEFFEKGGGSFLWFIPAIMLFYLTYPFFVRWKHKYKSLIVLIIWFVAGIIIGNVVGYTDIFIFTNRIPIIIAGYELKRRVIPAWCAWIGLPIGILVSYKFGFMSRLNLPFADFYFVTGMILALAICGISCYIKPAKVWDILGMGTLELYCIQMIFGVKYANRIYLLTENILLTNAIVIITMFALATAISILIRMISKRRT